MAHDYRDLVVEQLADDLAAMTDRAINAEAARDAYRAVAVAGLHHINHLQAENDRLHRNLQHVQDEYRAFREQVVTTYNPLNSQAMNTFALPAGYGVQTSWQPGGAQA